MRTLISRPVTVSVYKTVNKPIQHHTAVHYNICLQRTPMKLRLQQSVTPLYSWDFQRRLRGQVQSAFVAAFRVHSVECVEGVWGEEKFDIYRPAEG